ncbi:MAG: hypothetical protein ACXVCM_18725 [Ktedonobacteraceae bacterium]
MPQSANLKREKGMQEETTDALEDGAPTDGKPCRLEKIELVS